MAFVVPSKAGRPVAISYSTAPKLKRSVRASSFSRRACSGDMYATVPKAVPGLVRCSGSIDAVGASCLVSAGVPPAEVTAGNTPSPGPATRDHPLPWGPLCLAARRNKDIGRLDVAVSDALRVCRIQPIGYLDREVQQLVRL